MKGVLLFSQQMRLPHPSSVQACRFRGWASTRLTIVCLIHLQLASSTTSVMQRWLSLPPCHSISHMQRLARLPLSRQLPLTHQETVHLVNFKLWLKVCTLNHLICILVPVEAIREEAMGIFLRLRNLKAEDTHSHTPIPTPMKTKMQRIFHSLSWAFQG